MRGLSLTQPWATLMAIGAKTIETRSWPTTYRGPVAIHASRAFPAGAVDLCYDERVYRALNQAGIVSEGWASRAHIRRTFVLGAIVAIGELEHCWPTAHMRVSEDEGIFGDYTPGRYAFVFRSVLCLPSPIPWRGALGLWPVPPQCIDEIQMQLAGWERY